MALDLSGGASERLAGAAALVWLRAEDQELTVSGLTLAERAIFTACRAGFERLLIVVEGPVEALRDRLAFDHRLSGRAVDVLAVNGDWLRRIEGSRARWVVLPAEWIVAAEWLHALALTSGEPTAAAPDGPIAADAAALVEAARLSGGAVRPRLAPRRLIEPPDLYQRVAGEADVPAAVDALFESLARNVTNFFARWVDRPMSRAISRLLAPYPITPNQITIFSTLLGIAGALCLLRPTYGFGVLGSFLFFASTVIDGCDGEIARLKFQESSWGAKLDLVCDNVVHAFLFPCVALRFYFADPGGPYLLLGGVSLAGVAATWLALYLFIVRRPPSARVTAYFEVFANREFAYLFLLLGLAGRLDWFVWAMAFGLWFFPLGLTALALLDFRGAERV